MLAGCRSMFALFTLSLFTVALPAMPRQDKNSDVAAGITTPKEFFGFNIGDDYQEANYTQAEAYWKKLASESNRMRMVDIGLTSEGRHQWMSIITSPENMKHLDHYKEISQKLARAENLTDDEARQLAADGKAIVWIDGGLHASETVGFQQLVETIYQLVSLNDPETLRFLHDDIILCVAANPDGSEFVANWYMRNSDPKKRTNDPGFPKLYNKYVGHDDNRDSYMSNMPETANINRQLFIEWYPEIMYNHHQTGPAGAVIFMPPFRDPFNYNYDPLIPLGIEAVGTAMHERLVEHGMAGSAMRSGANYSTWWDGGLRTTDYFHNMIGILTEIIGEPTPIQIPLVAQKQLPTGDWPMPIAPQTWHYRQSIDYEMQNNRAILDYASRNRETLLYNIYLMGKNSIDRGNKDSWTITPDRIAALEAAKPATPSAGGQGSGTGGGAPRGRSAAAGGAPSPAEVPRQSAAATGPATGAGGEGNAQTLPAELYGKVLHDPAHRDPRGYVLSADQPDFARATYFINTLIKNGIEVEKATSTFAVNGRSYPAGSFVVMTAQAARPFVLDMFQAQHHPNDFRYPGGPPIPPYDIAGWTEALQMDIQFDTELDGFTGPFTRIPYGQLQPMPSYSIEGPSSPAGYLISHQINNSFVLTNRLMKAGCDVYWLQSPQKPVDQDLGTGVLWVPASSASTPIVEKAAHELGVRAYGIATPPSGPSLKLKPIRIGLFDQYGGLMPSGWVRWLFDQYEFPYEVVFPQQLDAGGLKDKFDVLVFIDAAGIGEFSGRGGGGMRRPPIDPTKIPEQYRSWTGNLTTEKTIPQLKKFVEDGGSVITIGPSVGIAQQLGVPVANYLTEMAPDGHERPLPGEKFYIPGSLMRITIDNTDPIAYGMPLSADVDFDNSPVFRIVPENGVRAHSVAWFASRETLDSGWAWGQAYLDGGTAIARASVGAGSVVAIGPEVTFRGQPHGTFPLLFNALYAGSATPAAAPGSGAAPGGR